MGFESARKTLPEAPEKSIEERIAENELRVQRLLGETQAHLSGIPSGDELARTVEGQAKLLKLQAGAQRFNERVISAVGAVANFALLTRLYSQIPSGANDFSPQTWHMLSELGAGGTVSAALIGAFFMLSKGREFSNAARGVLDRMNT